MNGVNTEHDEPVVRTTGNRCVLFNVIPETYRYSFGIPIVLPSVYSPLSQTTQNHTIIQSDINSHSSASQQLGHHTVSILPNVVAPNYNVLPVVCGGPVMSNVLYFPMAENVGKKTDNENAHKTSNYNINSIAEENVKSPNEKLLSDKALPVNNISYLANKMQCVSNQLNPILCEETPQTTSSPSGLAKEEPQELMAEAKNKYSFGNPKTEKENERLMNAPLTYTTKLNMPEITHLLKNPENSNIVAYNFNKQLQPMQRILFTNNNPVVVNEYQVMENETIKKCPSVLLYNSENLNVVSDVNVKHIDPVHKKFSGPLKSILRNSKKNEIDATNVCEFSSLDTPSVHSKSNVDNMFIVNDKNFTFKKPSCIEQNPSNSLTAESSEKYQLNQNELVIDSKVTKESHDSMIIPNHLKLFDENKSTSLDFKPKIISCNSVLHNEADTGSSYISLNTDNAIQNQIFHDNAGTVYCMSLQPQSKELANKNILRRTDKKFISNSNLDDLNLSQKITSTIKVNVEEPSLENGREHCAFPEQTFTHKTSKSPMPKHCEAIPYAESLHLDVKPILNECRTIHLDFNSKNDKINFKTSDYVIKDNSQIYSLLKTPQSCPPSPQRSNERQLPLISKTSIKSEFIESDLSHSLKVLQQSKINSDQNSKVIHARILHQETDTNKVSHCAISDREGNQVLTDLHSNSSVNKNLYEVKVSKISIGKRTELILKREFPAEVSNSLHDTVFLSMEQMNVKVKTEPSYDSLEKNFKSCKFSNQFLQREPLKPLTVTDCEANTEVPCPDIKPNIVKCEAEDEEYQLLFKNEHEVDKKLVMDTENVMQMDSNEIEDHVQTYHELSSIKDLGFSQGYLLITNTAMCSDGIQRLLANCYDNGKCLICGFVSSSLKISTHRNHLMTHLETKKFVCGICGASFRSKPILNSHKESHNQPDKFDCKVCDKKFKTRGSLLAHTKRHEEKNLVECPICEKNLSNKRNLKNHILIHTGEKPYSCSICQKEFGTRKKLNNHSYVHASTKQYNCEVCNRAFHRATSLKQHANMHISEKKYKCDICDKEFNFYANLKQHQVVHSAERQHNCETCGMKFKLPHHLRQHLVIHDPT